MDIQPIRDEQAYDQTLTEIEGVPEILINR